MLHDYRQKNPNDKRSDEELLKSLMDHFVESSCDLMTGRMPEIDLNGLTLSR